MEAVIVIPTYNEKDNLRPLVCCLIEHGDMMWSSALATSQIGDEARRIFSRLANLFAV